MAIVKADVFDSVANEILGGKKWLKL
jgi:hypothetical protein